MERAPDIQHFIERCIRSGIAALGELRDTCERYGAGFEDAVAEELSAAGVRLVDEKDMTISPQTNVLMNNLALAELVSVALRLPAVPKIQRRLYRDIMRARSHELDLTRLGYLDSDQDWYYLSPSFNRLQHSIRRLFDSGEIPFAKEWRGKEENEGYLRGLMAHPRFADRVLPQIREHYLRLRGVTLLARWIRSTGKSAPVMVDIIQAGLNEAGPERVRQMLFSEHASTAHGALRNRRDICFFCRPERRCTPLQNVKDASDALMEYRYSELGALLSTRYPGLSFDQCLLRDGLVLKFFVPYSIVVSSKSFMIDVGCLDSCAPILRKNVGKYCPYADTWPLARLGRSEKSD